MLNPHTGLIFPQFHVIFDNDFTTVLYLQKQEVPPDWAKLVLNFSEKTTNEFYDLTKTWFCGQSDEDADEIIMSPNKEASPLVSKGGNDSLHLGPDSTLSTPPIISQMQSSDGDSPSPASPNSKGGDNISMPTMINLETAGLRRPPRIAEKNKSRMSFTTIITKLCVFRTVLSSCLQPTFALSIGQAPVNSLIH